MQKQSPSGYDLDPEAWHIAMAYAAETDLATEQHMRLARRYAEMKQTTIDKSSQGIVILFSGDRRARLDSVH